MLRKHFNRVTTAYSTKVANLLTELNKLRTLADYDLGQMYYAGQTITPAELLRRATKVGQQLLTALDSYSPGESPDGCKCPVN